MLAHVPAGTYLDDIVNQETIYEQIHFDPMPMGNVQQRRLKTGYIMRPWQREVHSAMEHFRFNVLVVHRRGGKTHLCGRALVDAATRKPGGVYAYIAPYLKQAKRVAWRLLVEAALEIPDVVILKGELTIQFPNGAVIMLFGADNYESLLGMGLDGVVLDEIARMKTDVWGETVRPMLADRPGSWAIFISTPKGMNLFFDLHEYGLSKDKKYASWMTQIWDVNDTKQINKYELQDARATQTENQYRQEWLCDFQASAEDILITLDMANDAQARLVPREEWLHSAPKILGVDIARFGDDSSVIQKRWGQLAYPPKRFEKCDNMEMVGQVANLMNSWKPDACFIDGGRGEGVIDRLRELGHNVIEVNFGGKAGDESYANKRSEMWDGISKWLEQGGVLPQDRELKRDICGPTYTFSGADNKFLLEKKADTKERIKRSPDAGDALALTFAFPVIPKQRDPNLRRNRTAFAKTSYDRAA